MKSGTKIPGNSLFSLDFWQVFGRVAGKYLGVRRGAGKYRLDTPEALGAFLASRASHVAQASLYGYLKTRAGTSFPTLFENSAILASINIAKWHVWLACLSDLAIYGGVLLRQRSGAPLPRIRALLEEVVAGELRRAGAPQEAGDDFADGVRKLQSRIAHADLDGLGDDDSAFTESPAALVYWSPVADELKSRDVEIIRNSVRFRWQEVRRSFRRRLRATVLVETETELEKAPETAGETVAETAAETAPISNRASPGAGRK